MDIDKCNFYQLFRSQNFFVRLVLVLKAYVASYTGTESSWEQIESTQVHKLSAKSEETCCLF